MCTHQYNFYETSLTSSWIIMSRSPSRACASMSSRRWNKRMNRLKQRRLMYAYQYNFCEISLTRRPTVPRYSTDQSAIWFSRSCCNKHMNRLKHCLMVYANQYNFSETSLMTRLINSRRSARHARITESRSCYNKCTTSLEDYLIECAHQFNLHKQKKNNYNLPFFEAQHHAPQSMHAQFPHAVAVTNAQLQYNIVEWNTRTNSIYTTILTMHRCIIATFIPRLSGDLM